MIQAAWAFSQRTPALGDTQALPAWGTPARHRVATGSLGVEVLHPEQQHVGVSPAQLQLRQGRQLGREFRVVALGVGGHHAEVAGRAA